MVEFRTSYRLGGSSGGTIERRVSIGIHNKEWKLFAVKITFELDIPLNCERSLRVWKGFTLKSHCICRTNQATGYQKGKARARLVIQNVYVSIQK